MPIMMTRAGDSVKVAKILGNDSVRQRLGELGFVAGTPLWIMQSQGGNVIVKIRDSRLALTREMASKVMVEMQEA